MDKRFCHCGKEIDPKYDLCYECNEKQKTAPNPGDRKSMDNSRSESIERQTAAKCVAQVFEGQGFKYSTSGVEPKDFESCFMIFHKLIKDGKL